MNIGKRSWYWQVKALMATFAVIGALVTPYGRMWAENATQHDVDDQAKLEAYQAAKQTYRDAAAKYWAEVSAKRLGRLSKRKQGNVISANDYVLNPPPTYSGPPPPELSKKGPESSVPKSFPVVADLIKAAREKYAFAPDLPKTEKEYKQAYAKTALSSGLTKDQLLTVYIFETGGVSGYDTQAGLETKKPNAQPVSTALGYNQLLDGNSVELLDERGDKFLAALVSRASYEPAAVKKRIERKLPVLRKMIAFAKLVPGNWSDHDRWVGHRTLALTAEGRAIHALNLDIDIGPLLQVQKLADSIAFAARNGLTRPMTGAELELLNLMGDPRGIDAITTPAELMAKVPVWNFFDPDGYDANPVVKGKSVAQLLSVIEDRTKDGANLSGAKALREAF